MNLKIYHQVSIIVRSDILIPFHNMLFSNILLTDTIIFLFYLGIPTLVVSILYIICGIPSLYCIVTL